MDTKYNIGYFCKKIGGYLSSKSVKQTLKPADEITKRANVLLEESRKNEAQTKEFVRDTDKFIKNTRNYLSSVEDLLNFIW